MELQTTEYMEEKTEERELNGMIYDQLDGTVEHLKLIMDGFEKGAEMFRMEDAGIANDQYLISLDALQQFLRFIEDVRQVYLLDFASIFIDKQSLEDKLEQLQKQIEEMFTTQQSLDWIFLADLIEYELVEELKNWPQILIRLKEEIKAG